MDIKNRRFRNRRKNQASPIGVVPHKNISSVFAAGFIRKRKLVVPEERTFNRRASQRNPDDRRVKQTKETDKWYWRKKENLFFRNTRKGGPVNSKGIPDRRLGYKKDSGERRRKTDLLNKKDSIHNLTKEISEKKPVTALKNLDEVVKSLAANKSNSLNELVTYSEKLGITINELQKRISDFNHKKN